jgi:hypothetical protein
VHPSGGPTVSEDGPNPAVGAVFALQSPGFCSSSQDRFSKTYIVLSGHAVALLVEALRYKMEGGRFDSR